MNRARTETTVGKMRTIRSLKGKTLRIDIEGGSYVTIQKDGEQWCVHLNKKPLDFRGTYKEAVSYAWSVVHLVDCDMM